MITQVFPNLFVADMEGCRYDEGTAVIHACKHPCYESIMGNVPKSDPNYLFIEIGNNLYLNIIDPDKPLFCRTTFDVSLQFISKHIEKRKVVIHCNEGRSRSASIAMLFLFKKLHYRNAVNEFLDVYNEYEPSLGIEKYLGTNWWNWYDPGKK